MSFQVWRSASNVCGMSEPAIIRADILARYPELFGDQSVNGRVVDVQTLIADMTRATRADFRRLLRARHELQARVAQGAASFDWLDADLVVSDAEDHRASVGAIRRGMLDAFAGRSTPGRLLRVSRFLKRSPDRDWKARARPSIWAWRWGRSTAAPRPGCGIGKTPPGITVNSCIKRGAISSRFSMVTGMIAHSCTCRRRGLTRAAA